MKNIQSLIVVFLVTIVFVFYRVEYLPSEKEEFNVTTWDAFGYYAYLPATFIYNDLDSLEWVDEIDEKYDVTRGGLYQFRLHDNGNYVGKYFVGISILQSPFFFVGHSIAKLTDYPADGFSAPYQYALAFGVLLYTFLALLLLRKILLRYYLDRTVALTLLFLCLASNLIQYVSIDGIQSHSYIFLLYTLVLYFTIKWHEKPTIKWAVLIGLTIGLATICRPTELIMLFIPLLWSTQNKEEKTKKWKLVRENIHHLYWVIGFGIIGILPQIIYWYTITGSLIYDVGSSWRFLTPFFRVLFGFENGWFIYTPITVFFVLGFFFIKKFPFKRSVVVFCLLNIWIVISWADWKYGGTYATRALVQSYPVFALAFAGIIQLIESKKIRFVFYAVGAYLIFVNLFQIDQYNKTILHFRDMNRKYYSKIYLNDAPSPLDMSFLDTDEEFNPTTNLFERKLEVPEFINLENCDSTDVCKLTTKNETWVKVTANIEVSTGYYGGRLICESFSETGSRKRREFRLNYPNGMIGSNNAYELYYKVPKYAPQNEFVLRIASNEKLNGKINQLEIIVYEKKV